MKLASRSHRPHTHCSWHANRDPGRQGSSSNWQPATRCHPEPLRRTATRRFNCTGRGGYTDHTSPPYDKQEGNSQPQHGELSMRTRTSCCSWLPWILRVDKYSPFNEASTVVVGVLPIHTQLGTIDGNKHTRRAYVPFSRLRRKSHNALEKPTVIRSAIPNHSPETRASWSQGIRTGSVH